MKYVLNARRAFRAAIPCRDTRGMHYTQALTGNSVGVILGVMVAIVIRLCMIA